MHFYKIRLTQAKRHLTVLLMTLLMTLGAKAVLKEKNLESTLSILRAELTVAHRELSCQNAENRKRAETIREQLVDILRNSNRNSLMLYSQKQDYVFDLTYACHEATEQYQKFQRSQLPFKTFLSRTEQDIARYDSLIASLRHMPVNMLSEEAKTDRNVCLTLAANIRNTLVENKESTQDYIRIYEMAERHLKNMNDYANKRYTDIQTSIFKNGDDDYFTILSKLGKVLADTQETVVQKYKRTPNSHSQWDSRFIFGLFLIILFYGIVASALNLLVFRLLIPKRFRTEEFMKKRTCIILAATTVTFAVILGIISATTQQNFIIMASNLLVEYAWLLGVILISLLLRLNSEQIRSAFRIYSPLMVMGFIVISFRIILIPNELVKLVFPPFLLACACWQWLLIRRYKSNIPRSDMFYTYASQAVFITSVVCSWTGYTLFSVQILIWWIMQLTCILTITCLRRWINLYGTKRHIQSRPITQKWNFNLIYQVALPVMSVLSVMISIYWAADVFNLSDLCWHIFSSNIIDLPNFKVSILRLATVISMWFAFSYICSTTMELLRMHFEASDPNTANSKTIMSKNVIQVIVWGAWMLISLSALGTSFTWLVVVSGGLSTGIGFASKDILENIYYGISLMTGRIKVGDLIECDGIRGKVASINYTSTLLESNDGSVIAFQNSQLFTKNYKNLTRNHGYALSVIYFGVAYGSNLKQVTEMVENAVNEMHHPLMDSSKKARAVLVDFGDNSVNLKLLCWVEVLQQAYVESDIKDCIYRTLNDHHIEIPFPQCDVHIKQS